MNELHGVWDEVLSPEPRSPPSDGGDEHDESPPQLYLVLVQGTLIFDRVDLALDASYIFVTGALQVGTEADPFLQRAVITLHGSPVSTEIPLYGAKNIGCRGCTLDLHGAPVARTWTYLARTAERMATQLRLTEAVDWEVGSQIVVTSTAASGCPSA